MKALCSLFLVAPVLLVTGCTPSKQDLAQQVVVEKVEFRPWTNSKGKPYQLLRVHLLNTGDTPLASVYAKVTPYDKEGDVIVSDTSGYLCIFAVGSPSERLAKNQRGQTSGDGIRLTGPQQGRPAVRVDVLPVEADTQVHRELL